ncbi:MAG: tetratricopeptide repeat protein [Deltaproteobacteria bacterium]|nr:tetratricopeptide repeat protein [Deltaproteobacteria bacterium]
MRGKFLTPHRISPAPHLNPLVRQHCVFGASPKGRGGLAPSPLGGAPAPRGAGRVGMRGRWFDCADQISDNTSMGSLMSSMKTRQRIFSALIGFSMLFVLSGNSNAAEKIFIKEYTYQASEIDSKVTSRAQALEQAKRLVLEELGTYLISKTEVKDFAISSDKITVLTAGVVQTEIFDEKWDGKEYYLKARITADPDKVAKAIDKLRKDEGKTKELEDAKKRADDALEEIARLKAELDVVKDDKSKQLEYANTVNTLSATDWFEKGLAFGKSEDYDNAIEAFSQAIEFEPYYVVAYIVRGVAYNMKGQYDRAIKDYNKTISLKPDYAEAYHFRGVAYANKDQYDKAIKDYNKAISLKPDYAEAYYVRGNAYYMKDQYGKAIEDFNKAISLKPDYGLAYFGRGLAYSMKREYKKAIADSKKACELGDVGGCFLESEMTK